MAKRLKTFVLCLWLALLAGLSFAILIEWLKYLIG